MQLPKSHTPHKVTKKNRFQKKVNESTRQRVNKSTKRVNGSTRNRIIELSRFRESRGYRLNFFNFLTP